MDYGCARQRQVDKAGINKIIRHLVSDVHGAGGEPLDFGEVARAKIAIVLTGQSRHQLRKKRRNSGLRLGFLDGCLEIVQLTATKYVLVTGEYLFDQC